MAVFPVTDTKKSGDHGVCSASSALSLRTPGTNAQALDSDDLIDSKGGLETSLQTLAACFPK